VGAAIRRPSSWIGQFARGERHANLDDAVALAAAIDQRGLLRGGAVPPPPKPVVDPAVLTAERKWLKLFRRMADRPAIQAIAIGVVEALARRRGQPITLITTKIPHGRRFGSPHDLPARPRQKRAASAVR
jgi:hypothetical protein